jgi:hypothetical protein
MAELYEFHVYGASESGEVTARPIFIEQITCPDDAAARLTSRRLARSHKGPVDVALNGEAPWNDRYLGTASLRWPGSNSKATLFGRLD